MRAHTSRAKLRRVHLLRPVAALAILAGCGAPCGLQSARDRWYAATGLREPWRTSWTFEYAYQVPCAGAPVPADGGGRFVGCTAVSVEGGAQVTVAERDEQCAETTLHELGHVLGAGHHRGRGTLTASRTHAGYRACISEDDLELVCSVSECRWRRSECANGFILDTCRCDVQNVMSNATKRPQGRNVVIWRKATAADIKAGQERATRTHEHRYMNHVASPSHVACSCGWYCRRDTAPADLIFSGPVRPARQ
jgi:hypothetical protein